MAETPEPGAEALEVHTEARGKHWVAWVTRPSDPKPLRSVVIVAETREEAERRGREWAAGLAASS